MFIFNCYIIENIQKEIEIGTEKYFKWETILNERD